MGLLKFEMAWLISNISLFFFFEGESGVAVWLGKTEAEMSLPFEDGKVFER
jgi:hypothetical protein